MSQIRNRKLRPLLLSVLCLIVWHCVAVAPALAQRRASPNPTPETPSQRWLPLPQGGTADLKQQVQWLQQLKGLLGTESLGGATPALPKLDPEQMKALMEAMKQLNGGVPGGTQGPSLNDISPEQLAKAMADPAIREQARKMLEQFTRDGKLPQNGASADSPRVPFPTNSPERNRGTSGESPTPDRSGSGTGPDLSTFPPAMQKLLKQFAEQAVRQPNGVPPESNPFGGGESEREPGSDNRNSPSPDSQRPKPADEATPTGRSPAGGTPPLGGERLGTESPRGKPLPRGLRNPDERNANPTGLPNDPNRSPQPTRGDQLSTGNAPGTAPTEITPPSGTAARPRGSQPNTPQQTPGGKTPRGTPRGQEPPSAPEPPPIPELPRSLAEMLRNGPMPDERLGSDQSGPVGPRAERPDPREANSRDPRSAGSPPKAGPSLNDTANNGATNNSLTPGLKDRGSVPLDNPTANADRDPRGSAMSPEQRSFRRPVPPVGSPPANQPPMDIRSELEQQGFAQTLKKIVEQAREEVLANPNDSPVPPPNSLALRNEPSTGRDGSMNPVLKSVRQEFDATGREIPRQQPVPDRTPPGAAPVTAPPPVAPPPVANRPSAMNSVTKAAGNFLSDLATPPAPTPAPARPTSNATTRGATGSPNAASSRSAVGLLLLLAALGLAWYFVPQLLARVNASPSAEGSLGGGMRLIDIRSRRDVVRAFHEFALRPATPAPTWWTHREVERQVADETPALQPAIQTLADLYEQARYLPDEADFTPDQLGNARRALEQCETAPSRS